MGPAVKRKNFAPPLGPDTCQGPDCGALAQTALSASHETLRRLGYAPTEPEPTSVRVCVKCYLRGMAEAQARTRPSLGTKLAQQAPTVVLYDSRGPRE